MPKKYSKTILKKLNGIGITLGEAAKQKREFIKTGSSLLNFTLGGGYLQGGIVNIVGDESTGKSLLAQEGAAECQQRNFGLVVYDDTEYIVNASKEGYVSNETVLTVLNKDLPRLVITPEKYTVDVNERFSVIITDGFNSFWIIACDNIERDWVRHNIAEIQSINEAPPSPHNSSGFSWSAILG